MVCKEDILLWFKESASYKRIDVICNLLNMCIPFELRFVGTFVETIGKHSYQELRGAELKANNPSEIAAEVAAASGLNDGTFRRKITLYLSLLHSYNHTCAKGIFDILTSSDLGEILTKGGTNSPGDGNILEELLLLYTMALNHPAFTFEQHTCLGKILMQLLEEEKMIHPQPIPTFSVPIQRVPHTLPKNFVVVKTPVLEEVPPTSGPIPLPGPPPGIPLAPTGREQMIQQIPWGPPPPNPPSPHFVHTQESPVHSRTGSPVNTGPPIHPATRPQQNAHLSRRPPLFQNRQEIPNKKMVNCIEDKEGDLPSGVNPSWRSSSTRCQNGIRNCSGRTNVIPPVNCTQQHLYCTAQLEALNLDPEASNRHCSSSSESGRSSTSHSPPGTPHTPGRRKSDTNRPRMNGRVSSNPSASEVTSTPPPQTVFTQTQNVPYTVHGTTAYTIPPTFAANRSTMFTYPHQSYRPPPFNYPPNGELVYPYPAPFMPLIAYPSQVIPPKLSCWNCGAAGHTGHDCTEPTIEEITRPGNYQIDFSTSNTTTPPDCSTDK
ncbi:arginine-glutamic acid dipeptide repeats protein [Chrysoperla carnea]|uniref:arginine-glutamic acid dipeptide repeats protein n=1 Tax=Chrysoperla carnea TaxID=189513 RepID=UPI001D077DE9|nr:arginine-glutamic acid dipeptide repeats protein [Chrysoperla carnea]